MPEQVGLKTSAAPAKFPQIVISCQGVRKCIIFEGRRKERTKMIVWGLKNLLVSHEEVGKFATGSPQPVGSGLLRE